MLEVKVQSEEMVSGVCVFLSLFLFFFFFFFFPFEVLDSQY